MKWPSACMGSPPSSRQLQLWEGWPFVWQYVSYSDGSKGREAAQSDGADGADARLDPPSQDMLG